MVKLRSQGTMNMSAMAYENPTNSCPDSSVEILNGFSHQVTWN